MSKLYSIEGRTHAYSIQKTSLEKSMCQFIVQIVFPIDGDTHVYSIQKSSLEKPICQSIVQIISPIEAKHMSTVYRSHY